MLDSIKQKLKGDWVIWMIGFMLSLIGLLVVYSATGTLAFQQKGGNTEFYLMKQLLFTILGFVFMYAAHLVDYKYYFGLSRLFLILSFPLLILTLFIGVEINDAKRWLMIPGIGLTVQPSDFAKLALIMYVARFLSMQQDNIKDWKKSFMPIIFSIAGVCVLIAPANLSTAAVLFGSCLLLLFIGRVPFTYLFGLVALVAAGLLLIGSVVVNLPDERVAKIGRLGTWKNRIESYIGKEDGEKETPDYQVLQAKIAVARGMWFGQGPGQSVQRNYLPQAYNDFIFAIIIEEYGLILSLIPLILYLVLILRTMRIVLKSPKAFGALLAVGLSFSLVIQALINMGVAVNLFPVTGLALPFISMGGTTTLFTGLAFGIILSVSRGVEDEVLMPEPDELSASKKEVVNA